LGERLRAADTILPDDRILLDHYRRSLASFSHAVTGRLQQLLKLPITERPGKTTPSILAKLKRQSTALSRMQDVAGGRVVVADLTAQDNAVKKVREAFPDARFVDRRVSPIIGYHAAHFVIREHSQSYELQIRTEAQQRWAQLSEKFADLVGFEIKYGGGPETLRNILILSGRLIYLNEWSRALSRELLRRDEIAPLESGAYTIDRNQILHSIADADAELEGSFSSLENTIELLKQV
jgi:hypothetical protein